MPQHVALVPPARYRRRLGQDAPQVRRCRLRLLPLRGVAERGNLAHLALNDDVLVRVLAKTRTGIKADALAVLAACNAPVANLQISADAPAWFHPGRSGAFRLGANVIGHFGELHPAVVEALKVEGPLVGFEIVLDRIPEPKARATRVKPLLDLAAFQPVERDFAFVVPRAVAAGELVKAAAGVDRKLITTVNVFDLYEGAGIEADKKSVALSVTLQPREKTLTDAEIEAVTTKIVAEVARKTGATLRG